MLLDDYLLLLQSKQSKDELWHHRRHVINKQRMISLVLLMIVHRLIRVFSLITDLSYHHSVIITCRVTSVKHSVV